MYSAALTSKRLLAGRTTPLKPTSLIQVSPLSTRASKHARGRERPQYLLQRVVPQRYRRALSQTPPPTEDSEKGETASDKASKQGAQSSSSSANSQYQVATGFAGGNPFSSGSSVTDAVLTTVAGIGLGMCYIPVLVHMALW